MLARSLFIGRGTFTPSDEGGGDDGGDTPLTDWPDATNTGVPSGTSLTASGAITTTTTNQVISGKEITGGIKVTSTGVIIEKCKIFGNGATWVVDSNGYAPIIRDCEIYNNGVNGGNAAILLGPGAQALRNNIYGCENGIVVEGNNLIQDNYIHDLGNSSNADPHIDGVAVQNGSNVEIRHNHIESWNNSCVFIKDDFSAIDDVTIDNNLLTKQSGKFMGYTVYSDSHGQSGGGITNVRYTNNVIERGDYGYSDFDGNSPTWTGNTDYNTGNPI